jgi:phage tail-like protein
MARSIDTDLYHNFRFHVVDPAGGNLDPVAGFSKVTIPNISMEPAEYREGVYKYTRKYPGIPKVGDCEMTKGVVKKNSDFLTWIFKPINGGQNYRSDLLIEEYHISDEFGIAGTPSRIIRIKEVFPVDVKPSADKDATQADVSLQTLKLAVEEIEVEVVAQ